MIALCRLCASLKASETMTFIGNECHDLHMKLQNCCQLDVNIKYGLPRGVCPDCVNKLNMSFEFYQKVHESQQALEKLLNIQQKISNTSENKGGILYEGQTSINLLALVGDPSGGKEQALHKKGQASKVDYNDPLKSPEFQNDYDHDNGTDEGTDVQNQQTGPPLLVQDLQIEKQEVANTTEFINENNSDGQIDMEDEEQIEEEDYSNFDNENYEIIEIEESMQINQKQDDEVREQQIPYNSPFFETEEPTPTESNTSHQASTSTWLDYPWKCIHCDDIFLSAPELLKHHEQINVKDSFWTCADCLKVFPRYYSLINHVRQRHRRHLALICDVCNETFETYRELNNHRQSMHSNKFLKMMICPTCGKGFNDANSLQIHCKCHLPDDMRVEFDCDLCGKKFRSSSSLKFHRKIHEGMKEFVCDQCGKKFVQRANLEEHLLTHTEFTPYECDTCQKHFKTSERLSRHKLRHTDEKRFECNEVGCNKRFRTKDAMNSHIRIHTGEMPYKCEYCAKPFRFRSTLLTHHNIHTGLRPYSCYDCDHQFTNWPNYNKHMKRRHGTDLSSKNRRGKQANNPKQKVNTNKKAGKNTEEESDSLKLVEICYENLAEEDIMEDEKVKEITEGDFGSESLELDP